MRHDRLTIRAEGFSALPVPNAHRALSAEQLRHLLQRDISLRGCCAVVRGILVVSIRRAAENDRVDAHAYVYRFRIAQGGGRHD
jgi:hypothetical protein